MFQHFLRQVRDENWFLFLKHLPPLRQCVTTWSQL